MQIGSLLKLFDLELETGKFCGPVILVSLFGLIISISLITCKNKANTKLLDLGHDGQVVLNIMICN